MRYTVFEPSNLYRRYLLRGEECWRRRDGENFFTPIPCKSNNRHEASNPDMSRLYPAKETLTIKAPAENDPLFPTQCADCGHVFQKWPSLGPSWIRHYFRHTWKNMKTGEIVDTLPVGAVYQGEVGDDCGPWYQVLFYLDENNREQLLSAWPSHQVEGEWPNLVIDGG